MIRHAALPVPIPAVIPVIAAVPTNVPADLNIIPVLMPARLSAGQLAITVKTALPAVLLTPVHTQVLPNAEAAITALILALPEQRAAFPAPETTSPRVFLQPSAEPAVMNADIILIVT